MSIGARFEGKAVIVTGAASGIGRATLVRLSQRARSHWAST